MFARVKAALLVSTKDILIYHVNMIFSLIIFFVRKRYLNRSQHSTRIVVSVPNAAALMHKFLFLFKLRPSDKFFLTPQGQAGRLSLVVQ
jgi:hypothetical protein